MLPRRTSCDAEAALAGGQSSEGNDLIGSMPVQCGPGFKLFPQLLGYAPPDHLGRSPESAGAVSAQARPAGQIGKCGQGGSGLNGSRVVVQFEVSSVARDSETTLRCLGHTVGDPALNKVRGQSNAPDAFQSTRLVVHKRPKREPGWLDNDP